MSQNPAEKPKSEKPKRKIRRSVSSLIAVTFLVTGILALILAVYASSQILAFIGLGVTFWGALFLFITPVRYVESSLLTSTAASMYSTIDRIISDFKYAGKGYYVPPYPQEAYLPEHLKGLKDTIVFIAAQKNDTMPSIEETAQGKFLLTNPKGILIVPPGLGLLNQIKKKIPATKIKLNELCEVLPRIILEDFNIAKDLTMHTEADRVKLTIHGSLYKNLYNPKNKLKSIYILGCPLTSAIACTLAITTGKAVTIQKTIIYPGGSKIDTEYQIMQG
jgi:hypothetical protein